MNQKMNYRCEILNPKIESPQNFDFWDELINLDCFSVVKKTDDLECLQDPCLQDWRRFENFIIFGTGGSALGGKCLCELAKSEKKIKFIDNLDPTQLAEIFSETDFSKTGFLGISKSGETLETISQILLALQFLQKNSLDPKKHFVFITEPKLSSLRELAVHYDIFCLDHPNTIGGRFSVFSIVGMLPAVLAGLDPNEIREGGKEILENFEQIISGANFVFKNFSEGIAQHVSFIYSEKLKLFGQWLAQLYAESTGKSGIGITPLTAIGAVDQHSQLQLYLDGPNDKCFSFFVEKNLEDELKISEESYLPYSFKFLANKNVSEIFSAQSQATISVLAEQNRSIRIFEFSEITPKLLGSLFMHFMLEVACVSKLINVNPFNQPAVEKGKILTKKILDESHGD